ncbi:MAG: hypothetical protein U0931_29040 [Vulcanimicrobiota bacterium]
MDQILRPVSQLLRWAFTVGHLATDPTRELVLPRPVQPVAEKLSWKELRLLFKAPDRSTAVGLRDAALLCPFYNGAWNNDRLCSSGICQAFVAKAWSGEVTV